ncbi:MAG: hypothetical protein R3Y11_11060 [Pseudomonadota bacterium]
MTITTTSTVEKYVGDGSQNAWPITFPFFDSEDIKACIVNSSGVQVDLSYGTDYTVESSTGSMGGTLYYTVADGIEMTIWLSLPITQETDFYNTGPLDAETLEDGFDRLTLIAQQLQEESDRSIKVATSSSETPEELLADLYTARDTSVASASAAASSAANAAASESAAAQSAASMASSLNAAVSSAVSASTASAAASASAASTSASNAATSATNAANSAITAQAWAESETAPDPNDAESKSAKSWALSASSGVPIASTTYAGKVMASASFTVDQTTGEAAVPNIVPTGGIIMWSGSTTVIPTGWALCDGTNGTPNLVDRFIVGAGSTYEVGGTGGSASVTPSGTIGSTTLTTAQLPAHNHTDGGGQPAAMCYNGYATATSTVDTASVGATTKIIPYTSTTGASSSHTHTFSCSTSDNLPPYYALAYIMKL